MSAETPDVCDVLVGGEGAPIEMRCPLRAGHDGDHLPHVPGSIDDLPICGHPRELDSPGDLTIPCTLPWDHDGDHGDALAAQAQAGPDPAGEDVEPIRRGARRAVEATLADLRGRAGIGNEIEAIESDHPETWSEIIESCTERALEAMREGARSDGG